MQLGSGSAFPEKREAAPGKGAASQDRRHQFSARSANPRVFRPVSQAEALRRADEHASAAQRRAEFGQNLGGRYGAVFVDLAGHYARRAVAFRLMAEGLA